MLLLLIFANNIDKAGGVRDDDFNHIGAEKRVRL